jgi:hypothetical protein
MRTAAHSLLCLLIACAAEPVDRPPVTGDLVAPRTIDSGGIRILEHSAAARGAAPQLSVDTVPVAVIGERPDGTDDVTRVWTAFFLPDNAIAFWNDLRSQLIIHGPDGRPRGSIGQRGEGPEDFGAVHSIGISGDTLLVPDLANDRLGLYDASPTRVGTMRDIRACGITAPLGRLSGGAIIAYDGFELLPGPRSDTIVRPPTALVRFDGVRCDTLVVLPGREMRFVETRRLGRSRIQPMPVRFGRASAAAVWDTLIAVGVADAYRIDLLDSGGSVVTSIRADFPARPIPASARDWIVARELAQLRGPGSERRIDPIEDERLVREATFVADSAAPYERFLVGHDGVLWVVEGWAPGMRERSATAFRPDGSIVAHLRLPAALTPLAFGADRVLVRAEDPETGVVTFRSLRLIPRRP